MPDVDIDDLSYLTTGSSRLLKEVSDNGAGSYKVRDNTAATTAPTTGDDDGDGYGPGSIWYDTTNGRLYACRDASTGAAVWDIVGFIPSGLTDDALLRADGTSGDVQGATTTLSDAGLLAVPSGGDVTISGESVNRSASTIADNRLVRGDGGSYGTQQSGITCDDSDNLTGVVGITATGDIDTTGDVTGFTPGATNGNTSITAADSMRGQVVYTTAATAVTFTINGTPSTDLGFAVAQHGAGQVTFTAGGSVTLRYDSAVYTATTAAQYSMVFVHIKANNGDVYLSGDLGLV